MPELSYVSFNEVIIRLCLAAFLAALVGINRELQHKPFGLRTHMLLSLGTALFVLITMEFVYEQRAIAGGMNIDPSRVIQGIIAGIGFLGAGAIIRTHHHLVGATTGAGIWVVGGIGLACGLGLYWHAILVTIIALVIFVILYPLHIYLQRKTRKEE